MCTTGGAGTIYDSNKKRMIIDNGGLRKVGSPGGFASFRNASAILSAYTPWSPQGSDQWDARLAACAHDSTRPIPYGCIENYRNDTSVPWIDLVVVRNGAIQTAPDEEVGQLVIEQGGAVMTTNSSNAVAVRGDLILQGGASLFGCFGCASAAEAMDGLVGCASSCVPWSLATTGRMIVKNGAMASGVSVSVSAAGGMYVGETGSVISSRPDMDSFANITTGARVEINGTLWFSRINVTAATMLVGASGSVSADGLGGWGGDADGAGNSSLEGGGGGGHGGRGAESCYDFSGGGNSHGDASMPLAYGGPGGAGGKGWPNASLNEALNETDGWGGGRPMWHR